MRPGLETLRGICNSLEIEIESEILEQVAPLARKIQRFLANQRKDEGRPLSRSAFFAAIGMVNSHVKSLFPNEINAFLKNRGIPDLEELRLKTEDNLESDIQQRSAIKSAEFVKNQSISSFDQSSLEAEEHFEVDVHVRPAIERFAADWPERMLDALGLTYGIFATADEGGRVGKRLKEAGIDASDGLARIERAMGARFLEDFSFSSLAQVAIDKARGLVDETILGGAGLRTSLMLIAMADLGQNETDQNSHWFLYQSLTGGSDEGRARYQEARDDWIKRYQQHPLESLPRTSRRLSNVFAGLLNDAMELARKTTGADMIHARHLVGALLGYPAEEGGRTGAWEFIEEIGRDRKTLIEGLLAYLEKSAPSETADDLSAWYAFFKLKSRDDGALYPSELPGFDAEGFEGPDRLKIMRHVNSFAMLMASRSLEPPLSIGLFGDWGSGKSFFMRKLKNQIQHLAEAARRENTAFYSEIVQIEFNAWHYVEANLWASLVTHIFDRLHHHFVGQEDDVKEQWGKLLRKLDEKIELLAYAGQSLKIAEEQLTEASKREKGEYHVLTRVIDDIWNRLKENDETKANVEKIEETFKLEELKELKENILLQRESIAQLPNRLSVMARTLLQGVSKMRALGWFGVPAAVVIAVVVYLKLFPDQQFLSATSAGVAEITALIAAASGWIGSALKYAHRTIGMIEETGNAIVKGLTDEDNRQLREAEQKAALASDEVERRRKEIADLRVRMEELRPSQRLSNFLQDRATSEDYRKHLGLPAIIRRDFERLQNLMVNEFSMSSAEGLQAAIEDLDGGKIPELLRNNVTKVDMPFLDKLEGMPVLDKSDKHRTPPWVERIATGKAWRIHDGQNTRQINVMLRIENGQDKLHAIVSHFPKIDRIVLYIDDLDRCPPERVVEVLQAIHLLLTFPLFVVVVGVDARWVSRSLAHKYRDLWRHDGIKNQQIAKDPETGELRDTAAQPQDYLEKIFQIPFWLRPMTEEATEDYLDVLILPKERHEASSEGGDETKTDQQVNEAAEATRKDAEETVELEAGKTGLGVQESTEKVTSDDEKREAAATAGHDELGPSSRESLQEGAAPAGSGTQQKDEKGESQSIVEDEPPFEFDLNPKQLELTEEEHKFMKRLSSLISRSPRAVKRFVNVYRLLRAGIRDQRLTNYLEKKQYESVLLLLGIIIGAPSIVERVFSVIEESNANDSLSSFKAQLTQKIGPVLEADRWQSKRLINALDTLTKKTDDHEASVVQISTMKEWIGEVRRYSFRVGRQTGE